MNTESVNARRVADYDTMERPGDFYFAPVQGLGGETCLHAILPGGAFICIAVKRGCSSDPRVWQWDGNEERPTLHPSIDCHGAWHGWLRDGRFESC